MENRKHNLTGPFSFFTRPGLIGLICSGVASAAIPDISVTGEGWAQYGKIVHSSDTTTLNYNGNFIHAAAAQFLMRAGYKELLTQSDQLTLSIGLGMIERHNLGGANSAGGVATVVNPYIVEANFRYAPWNDRSWKLEVSGGFLPYNYHPDAKNLGLYLLRGSVYPGFLLSGFDTKYTLPLASILGLQFHHEAGSFKQDLLFISETDLYPIYDISPAYLASYDFGGVLRIGAGINLYHYISIAPKLTSPSTPAPTGEPDDGVAPVTDPAKRVWIYVDTTGGIRDTTYLSFKGTKVMAMASLDPKPIFGSPEVFGPEDLKIYGEVAVIGLNQSKAYKAIYGGLAKRMPVMVGFNIPAFKLLDHLSLEVEYYKADFRDDLQRLQPSSAYFSSPLPVVSDSTENWKRDDFKWSLHASRTLGNVKLTAQVANDHSRPGGKLLNPAAEWEAIYITPKDWYWMAKIAFFF
jgi:hypothetical protein